jgi:DNA mismatch repair protein MLH1
MIHHQQLAEELFYQLALARFGGATMARLGNGDSGGIDVEAIIAQSLQIEDDLMEVLSEESAQQSLHSLEETRKHLLEPSETNLRMAQQATMCLVDHAGMLDEYFSIRIAKDVDRVRVMGLPVLLDGHCPEPHGLAIFLLRLATRVDWEEERSCFHGVCRELGKYFALLPTTPDALETYVKHALFPALSYLLLPPERFQKDGHFKTMTKLSTLYKVFERC